MPLAPLFKGVAPAKKQQIEWTCCVEAPICDYDKSGTNLKKTSTNLKNQKINKSEEYDKSENMETFSKLSSEIWYKSATNLKNPKIENQEQI